VGGARGRPGPALGPLDCPTQKRCVSEPIADSSSNHRLRTRVVSEPSVLRLSGSVRADGARCPGPPRRDAAPAARRRGDLWGAPQAADRPRVVRPCRPGPGPAAGANKLPANEAPSLRRRDGNMSDCDEEHHRYVVFWVTRGAGRRRRPRATPRSACWLTSTPSPRRSVRRARPVSSLSLPISLSSFLSPSLSLSIFLSLSISLSLTHTQARARTAGA
jgi:hypothetical protein